MVGSSVEVPVSLPWTRLPTLTRWRLTRPVSGAKHVRKFDVELGRLQRAFGDRLGGVRRLQRLAALVDPLFGDRAGHDQVQAAIELALGQFHFGARIGELTVGLLGT